MPEKDTLETKLPRIWTPDLNLAMPIDTSIIPGFEAWVNWNGFHYGDGAYKYLGPDFEFVSHLGFDFAAYLTKDGKCVLGLPAKLPLVRSVLEGVVINVSKSLHGDYENEMVISHDGSNREDGMISVYAHVMPLVEEGRRVEKGQPIAALYDDEGYGLDLQHLHLGLKNPGSGVLKHGFVNPALFFQGLDDYVADPQLSTEFRIPQLKIRPVIEGPKQVRLTYHN